MKGVLLSDCKKGDSIFFNKTEEPEGTEPKPYHIGTIRSINQSRKTLLVDFQANIDGQIRKCTWYVKPEEVIGFVV